MSTRTIDDRDPNIFTNGPWKLLDYGELAYQGTISRADTAGASKVVRFFGTSISVRGGLQPIAGTANKQLVVQFIIDGGQPVTYQPELPTTGFQYLTYWQSDQLPLGEHVLTMVNMLTDDICLIDSFTIQANGGTAQVLRSNGSATPSKAPPPQPSSTQNSPTPNPPPTNANPTSIVTVPTTVTASTQPSTTPNTPHSSNTPSPSNSNTTRSSNTSQGASSGTNSSTLSFSAGVYQPTTIDANGNIIDNRVPAGTNRTPIIIATVTSALLLLALSVALFFLLRRRRRRAAKESLTTEASPFVNLMASRPQSTHTQGSYPYVSSKQTRDPYEASHMTTSPYTHGSSHASIAPYGHISSPPSTITSSSDQRITDEKRRSFLEGQSHIPTGMSVSGPDENGVSPPQYTPA